MKTKTKRRTGSVSRSDIITMVALVAKIDPAPYSSEMKATIYKCKAIAEAARAAEAEGGKLDLELERD